MKKFFIAVLFSILSTQASIAQIDPQTPATTGPHEKLFDHTIGVQINQLVREVLNFSNSTSANNNPYLLTYGINLRKSGWGLRFGLGYNSSSSKSDNGGVYTENYINNLQLRLGVEKSFKLSGNWTTGAGIDGLYNINDDKTTTNTNNAFDTSTAITHSTTGTYGAGAMAWLRYNLTEHIVLGTEVSFYYTIGKVKEDDQNTSNNSGNVNVTISHTNTDLTQGQMSLPIALFIMIKF